MTTTRDPNPAMLARAHAVAERLGCELRPKRGSVARTLRDPSLEALYVVGREAEWVTDGSERIFVHAGLSLAKWAAGADHPLIRAVAPRGAEHIIDGTLGLAGDALHLAGTTGAQVSAVEASPAVACLAESGLHRLAGQGGRFAEAVGRIRVHAGLFHEVAPTLPPAQGVFLAPMFAEPRAAAPGYAIFRTLANHRPFGPDDLDAALQVAPRVVVKVVPHDQPPEWLARVPREVVRGKALEYWVMTR